MKIDGACHCGYITYQAEIDPKKVAICHCTDCQTLSGSPFRAFVPATTSMFKLLTGQPKVYVKRAESGADRAQGFCPECGTPIYSVAAKDAIVCVAARGDTPASRAVPAAAILVPVVIGMDHGPRVHSEGGRTGRLDRLSRGPVEITNEGARRQRLGHGIGPANRGSARCWAALDARAVAERPNQRLQRTGRQTSHHGLAVRATGR